jgi:hypothetical protein
LPLEDICPVINVDNRKLYWVVRDLDASIQRSNLDGSNVEEIVADADIASNALSFDQAGGMLYWYESTLDQSKIRRVNLDGGPVENVVLLPTNPSGLYLNLAQQRMIWGIHGMLRSADLNGENAATILVGINTAGQLALDLEGGRIFWGDSWSVRVANLDGTELKIFWSEENISLSNFSFGPSLIQIDSEAGRIYWIFRNTTVTTAQEAQDILHSAKLDGSDLKTEGKLPLTGPYALDLVNQKVYGYAPAPEEETIAQQQTRELTRVNFDGTAPEALGILDNQFGSFLNLAIDGAGGKVYWTVGGTEASIQQANLDGSEQSEFMADLSSPGLLKIDHRANQIYWTNVPGGDANSTERANLDGSARLTIIENNVNSLAFDAEGLGTPAPDQDDGDLLLPFILGN